MRVAERPAGRLEFATATNRSHLSRLARSQGAQRLASGIYAVGATLPPEGVVRHHRLAIIAHFWPEAVLVGRTALAGSEPVDGWIYVSHREPARLSALTLPGLTVGVQIGPGQLPGDMSLPEGLWLSGTARGLVENVHRSGRPPRSQAGTAAVEDRIDELARTGGAGRISTALAQLDVIAGMFDPAAVETVRSRLAAVLGTFGPVPVATSTRLRARLAGQPFDEHRLQMLDGLIAVLTDHAPAPRPARAADSRWQWLAFFEAYFSNYIEGTEFGVAEARTIAIDGVIPASRPADAHDVAATYRLASDPANSSLVPRAPEELLEVLAARHRVLMAARPDKRPGQFKEQDNYAGGYRFVQPELVEGTLRRGFSALNALVDPFARAVAMMLLVTECHPFDDGNGRVARLMANAELTAAGQVRIVIPTVYRNNYLVGLTAVSGGAGRGESFVAVLDYAQKWTAAVQWQTYDSANADIEASNGYLDAGRAEASGLRLRLPPGPP
jgi:hypothetical protein